MEARKDGRWRTDDRRGKTKWVNLKSVSEQKIESGFVKDFKTSPGR